MAIEIVKAEIELYPDWANSPQALLETDSELDWDAFRFEVRNGTYRAEDEQGFVRFYHWGGQQDRGFGGSHFPIKMLDGSNAVLKGPWSSNAESVNQAFPDRRPVIEVTLFNGPHEVPYITNKGEKKIYKSPGGRSVAAATIDLVCRSMGWPEGMTYAGYLIRLYEMKRDLLLSMGKDEWAKNCQDKIFRLRMTGSEFRF